MLQRLRRSWFGVFWGQATCFGILFPGFGMQWFCVLGVTWVCGGCRRCFLASACCGFGFGLVVLFADLAIFFCGLVLWFCGFSDFTDDFSFLRGWYNIRFVWAPVLWAW